MADQSKSKMAMEQLQDIPPGSRLDIREMLALGARIAAATEILSDGQRKVSGNDLQARVPQIAAVLAAVLAAASAGKKVEQAVVVIDVHSAIDAIEIYWAALHAGLTPLLLPHGFAPSRLQSVLNADQVVCAISADRKPEFESLGLKSYNPQDLDNLLRESGAATIPPARRSQDRDLCSLALGIRADGSAELIARSHRSVALTGLIGNLIVGPGENGIGIAGPVRGPIFEWVLHCAIMARNHVAFIDEATADDATDCRQVVHSITVETASASKGRSRNNAVRHIAFVDANAAGSFRDESAYDMAMLGHDGHGFIGTCHVSEQPRWFFAPLVSSEIANSGATHPEQLLDKRPYSAQSGTAIGGLPVSPSALKAFRADVETLVRASAVQRPDAPALLQDDVSTSYGELLDRAARLAGVLKNTFGVSRGGRVAYIALNRIEFFEIYLACARLGAIFVPMNFRLSESEVQVILGDCKPKLIIAETELIRRLESQGTNFRHGRQLLCMSDLPKDAGSDYEQLLAAGEPVNGIVEPDDHETASILYTAGTTGMPKGVVRSHKAVVWFGFIFSPTSLRQLPSAAHLCSPPLFHIAGHETAALPALAMGRRVVVQRQFDAKKLLAAIDRFKITSAFLPPSMAIEIGAMLGSCTEDITSLRDVSSGSAPISVGARDTLCRHLPHLHFKNSLGMTEVGGIACLQGERLFIKESTCVGAVGPGVDIRIAGVDDHPLPVGQTGEIQIRSPQLFSAYWDRPDATLDAFAGGWFHTGDLGLIDDEGDLHIVGRIKDMIVTGGENVYAAEVERALSTIDGIADVAVIGVPDPKWGETVLACIVRSSASSLSEAEVIAQCRQKIAHYKCPRYCVFLDEFPRNAVGKVQKQALRQHWERLNLVSS